MKDQLVEISPRKFLSSNIDLTIRDSVIKSNIRLYKELRSLKLISGIKITVAREQTEGSISTWGIHLTQAG